jgi:hypothetical protein
LVVRYGLGLDPDLSCRYFPKGNNNIFIFGRVNQILGSLTHLSNPFGRSMDQHKAAVSSPQAVLNSNSSHSKTSSFGGSL